MNNKQAATYMTNIHMHGLSLKLYRLIEPIDTNKGSFREIKLVKAEDVDEVLANASDDSKILKKLVEHIRHEFETRRRWQEIEGEHNTAVEVGLKEYKELWDEVKKLYSPARDMIINPKQQKPDHSFSTTKKEEEDG